MMILNLSESLAKPLVMAKLNMAYLSSLKNRAKLLLSSLLVKFKKPSKTAVVLIAGVTISGTPCPRHFIVPFGAEGTFGPRGPGLSNPTSFLRPALPMAPTTDNNARDERSVLRPNPSDILKRFHALYDNKLRYYMKKVSKLYCYYKPFKGYGTYTSHSI